MFFLVAEIGGVFIAGGLVGMAGTATEEFGVGRSLAESRSSEHVENGSPLIEGKLWNTETRRSPQHLY